MFVYAFMWVHILVYAYTYEEQRLMLGVLIILNPCVWKTASHGHSLVSQPVPGIFLSYPPRTGFTDAHPIVTFTGDPGKQIQVLRFAHQAFYQPSHCPSPTRVRGADAWTVEVVRARKAQTADEVVGGVWAGKPWANRGKNSRWRTWFG